MLNIFIGSMLIGFLYFSFRMCDDINEVTAFILCVVFSIVTIPLSFLNWFWHKVIKHKERKANEIIANRLGKEWYIRYSVKFVHTVVPYNIHMYKQLTILKWLVFFRSHKWLANQFLNYHKEYIEPQMK